jgi:hypothetical protein
MFNEDKFRDLYAEYLESGLTIRDFCANQQINEAKFFYWQNKLKGKLPPKRGFIPVVFGKASHPFMQSAPGALRQKPEADPHPDFFGRPLACEITYPNGVRVKMGSMPAPDLWRSLLLLTEG